MTATNAVGTGPASAASAAVTPATVPGAPTAVTATRGNGQVTVGFTAPASNGGSAITSYTATSNPGNFTGNCTAPCASITVMGLANGTAYTFTVTATNAVGSGPASAASAAVTPATVPGAPTAVTATRGNGQVTVGFTAPASDGGSAITQYTATSNPGNFTGSCTAPCTSITVSGLTNGTAYTFTVTATNAVGTGPASAASAAVTPATVPGAPTAAMAAPGNAQATVGFTAPASNGGSAITQYTATSSPGNLTGSCTAPCTSITVSGLANGTAYTFTVTATNAVGTGPASAASNSITPSPPPNPPTAVTAVAGNAQATVSFAESASVANPVLGYVVTSNPAGGVDTNAGATVTKHVITGLDNGTAYTFTVTATNVVGASLSSVASNAAVPKAILGMTDAVKIAAGNLHSCAITNAGEVKCWGDNGSGQIGDGSSDTRLSPAKVSSLSGVTAIDGGSRHSCAVKGAGEVWCWGLNDSGQLGDGDPSIERHLEPVPVSGLASDATAVALGGLHTCALANVGATYCWGNNASGQLGNFTQTSSAVPVRVTVLGSNVLSIAAGADHSCAVGGSGTVGCWGSNAFGQLGTGDKVDRGSPPPGGIGTGVAVVAGDAHSCSLTSNGGVKCWGSNSHGQLGDDSTTERLVPVDVVGLATGVTAIAAGGSHTCALTSSGGVKCWGRNADAQLGDNSTIQRLTPVDVVGLDSGVTAIAAGLNHSCALTALGEARCWGNNANGQLGDRSLMGTWTPVGVLSTWPGRPANVTASAGNGHALVSFDPADAGDSAITTYTATSSPGNRTGSCTAPCTSILVAGLVNDEAYTFTVTATSGIGTGPASLSSNVVVPSAGLTTTSIESSANPSVLSQNVVFTATVTGAAPTGVVQFADNGAVIGGCGAVALAGSGNSRTATCSTAILAVGAHAVSASYGGGLGNAGSTSRALSQVVNASTEPANLGFEAPPLAGGFQYAPGGVGWVFSGNTGITGNGNAFTSGNPVAPEGVRVGFVQQGGSVAQTATLSAGQYTVSFKAAQRGNYQLGAQAIEVRVDGVAVGQYQAPTTAYGAYQTAPFAIASTGAHTLALVGVGSGGADFTGFIDDVRIGAPVAPATTTTGLASSANPAVAGVSVTFTATVTGAAPTGVVQFADNGAVIGGCGAVALAGSGNSRTATCSTASLAVGTRTITASYGGDGVNAGSISSALSQVINAGAPFANLGFEAPSLAGGFQYAPGGVAWVFSGNTGITGNGNAFTSGNPVAPEGVQVAFVQQGGSVSQTANLSAGQYTVSFKAAQRGNYQLGAQAIEVRVDGVAVGQYQAPTTAYGAYQTAPFNIANTGAHTVTLVGVGGGGADFTGFIDDVRIGAPVAPATTTTGLASSANPAVAGVSVTLTATVTGAAPTGVVQFADNGAVIGGCGAVGAGGQRQQPDGDVQHGGSGGGHADDHGELRRRRGQRGIDQQRAVAGDQCGGAVREPGVRGAVSGGRFSVCAGRGWLGVQRQHRHHRERQCVHQRQPGGAGRGAGGVRAAGWQRFADGEPERGSVHGGFQGGAARQLPGGCAGDRGGWTVSPSASTRRRRRRTVPTRRHRSTSPTRVPTP
ncbi:MAG: fibronectin type III domain-containing protein [Betaproteobacteria bacterium]|nr:fibronectin type III domain-containing protein [Betaproteobacteria bacterium]